MFVVYMYGELRGRVVFKFAGEWSVSTCTVPVPKYDHLAPSKVPGSHRCTRVHIYVYVL